MRRTSPLRLALAFLVAAAPALRAQAPAPAAPTPVTIGQATAVHSATLGEDRPVLIHLPPSYATAATRRYPVVYVLDGDAHFAAVSAMVDFLANNRRGPEMIVVAVPNTRDRTRDLTPPADSAFARFAMAGSRDSISQRFPTAGGAGRMRAFLTDELAPWVERQYRTAPFRVLVGHSFGGLFVLDALARTPRAFNAYVAISPSLWWDQGRYEKRIATALAQADLAGRSLYMTTGEREGAAMIDPARELATSLDAARRDGFRSSYRVMPGESHGSNPMRTTYDALEQTFAGWEPPDSATNGALVRGELAPLEAHYAALSKRLGFPVELSPDEVNQLAYFNLQERRLDVAVKLFRRNTTLAPDYANGWDSLADGLEAQGKLTEALTAQERAVSVGERVHDPNVAAYRTHLDRLRKAAEKR